MILFNQKFADILAYKPKKLRKKNFQEIVHSEDLQLHQQYTSQMLAGDIGTFSLDSHYLRSDGSPVWINQSCSLVKTVDNQPDYLVIIVQDIDKEKQALEALQESEARFRLMADHAPVMIWMTDTKGECTFLNQRWLDFSGRTLEAELGAGWREGIHPQERQRCLEIYESSLKSHLPFQTEYRYQSADKTYAWFLDTGVPRFTESGNFAGFIGSCVDISERKQLEEELLRIRKAIDSSSDAIGILDITGTSLYQNPAFIELFGYSVEELNEAGGLEAIFPNDEYYHTFFYNILNGKSWQQDLTISSRTGKKRQIDLRADALIAQDGTIMGLVITATDIQERKSFERQLTQANKKLKASVKALEASNREIILLGEMIEALQACFAVEEAYEALSMLIPPIFPGTSGGLFMIPPSRNLVEAVATWGEPLNSDVIFTPKECWSLRRGRAHWIAESHPGLCCNHIQQKSTLVESLCIPMIAQGETLGMLYLSSSTRKKLTDAKRHLAITVSEHIAIALANLRLSEQLQQQSVRDPLTGLFNRRYLEESLEREIHRAAREGQPLGIIMLDVDHFKRFNDTYGHEAGDIILRELGVFLLKSVRSSDIACRYGGEELTLILPKANLADIEARAEQIRIGVKGLEVRSRQELLGIVTISLGVACFPEHGLTGQELIQAADRALYQAKAQGRDRVIAAGDDS